MIPQGLNLLYLPPFSVIGRFFATAVLFGVLEGFFLTYQAAKGSLYLFPTVHFFTLGFMALTMIGALFQMLPVVAGAVIENPLRKAFITHTLLSLGALFLPLGILFESSVFTLLSLTLLLLGTFYIVPIMLKKLFSIRELRDAPRGFKYALSSFGIGVVLGALLILHKLGLISVNYPYLLEIHLSFMLYGWTATLVASVSFQVIEMFFVTPPYPKFFTKNFARILFSLLILKVFLPYVFAVDLLISALLITYALLTINRLKNRKRKIKDPLIYLWNISMTFLTLSALLYPFKYKFFYAFLIFFGVFVLSVIMSMMYRIIPFLVWMHLLNRGVSNPPTMHQVIDSEHIWLNFYIHIASILSLFTLLAGNSVLPSLFFFTDFLILAVNIYRGIFTYLKFSKKFVGCL